MTRYLPFFFLVIGGWSPFASAQFSELIGRVPKDANTAVFIDAAKIFESPVATQGRWLRSTDIADPSQRYSDYLGRAYRYATEVGTPLIMAIDLSHVASESQWAKGLGQFESWKGSEQETLAAAKLLAGIEGVTLGVTFGDRVGGSIRVDFSESPSALAENGKDLLIEVLENHGSMIEDFREWSPAVRDNTFRLSGPVSEAGLRRLLSVLVLPAPLAEALDEAQLSQDDSPESAARIASQQYFQSVTVLLDDLRGKGKRDGVKTFGQAATWYAKYARKIDALPLLNVDPLLVDYGRRVADGLRGGEMSMKGVGMRTAVRTAGSTTGYDDGDYGGYYGGYRGYYNSYGAGYGVSRAGAVNLAQDALRAEQQAETVVRTQERVAGAAAVQQLWTQIDQATAEIRRDMTAKYQVEF